MPSNFMTQGGLKVRLDLSYFMRMLTGKNKNYSSDEMTDNAIMNNMVSIVEYRYVYPVMLKWYFTLAILIFAPEINLYTYATIALSVALFGMLWRGVLPDIVLHWIINMLSMPYDLISRIWFLPYAILLAVGISRNKFILLAFVVVSALSSLLSLLCNHITLNITRKRFGFPFNDTEICAFTTFYIFLERTEGLNKFIDGYCSYINTKPETKTL